MTREDRKLDRMIERLIGDLVTPPTLSEVFDTIAKLPPAAEQDLSTYYVARFAEFRYASLRPSSEPYTHGRFDRMEFRRIATAAGDQWAYHGDVLAVPLTEAQLAAMLGERQERNAAARNREYLKVMRENILLRQLLRDNGVAIPEDVDRYDEREP